MGRGIVSRKQFEPATKQEPSDTVTCLDFHTLSDGSLGSSTQYERLATKGMIEDVKKPISATLHPKHLSDNSEPTMDEAMPVDPAYLDKIKEALSFGGKQEKRPTYTPLPAWVEKRDEFLTELLRREGRGDYADSACLRCGVLEANYRCTQCVGETLLCKKCIVSAHLNNPLHVVEEWTDGSYFAKVPLKSLGLSIQLGHAPGSVCPNSRASRKDGFIVIDLNGIHEVDLRFCGCMRSRSHFVQILRYGWYPASVDRPRTAATIAALKFFDILHCESKTSVFEFYQTLARLSDNTGTNPPKDRYSSLAIMFREYSHLEMLKHGARGHKPGGAAGTKPGELAVLCPACPQPGVNMAPDWMTATADKRFLHCLFIAIDANFRLKRRNISSEDKDPGLSKGWSYFVPQDEYRAHLSKYSKLIKQEKSTCANHQAVTADRASEGYAINGVAAVDCARHDMRRPLAVGDLERGERYVNTDFMFFTSLQGSELLDIAASYDIMCQWNKNLWKRMGLYPAEMGLSEEQQANFRCFVPKFHLPSHITKCQTQYSFNFAAGVGRTDGEAPERGWSGTNPIAASTTEMSPGHRRDTIDAFWGHTNWGKSSSLPRQLATAYQEAIRESGDYKFLHHQFTLGLSRNQIKCWDRAVTEWENDKSGKSNPFEKQFSIITEDKVRKHLKAEEDQQRADGKVYSLHEKVSAVDLITMGLDLEEDQRCLTAKGKLEGFEESNTDLDEKGQAKFLKKRLNNLLERIHAWIEIQHRYAPALHLVRERDMETSTSHHSESAITTRLYLPSAMAKIGQAFAYDKRLTAIEYQLRCAQADDALQQLRNALRLRSYVYLDKDRFQRGQRKNTRSRGIIGRLETKVAIATAKYRCAREAISQLAPILNVAWTDAYPVLNDADVRGFNDDDLPIHMKSQLTLAQKKKLLRETSKQSRRRNFREVSWIWRRLGAHRLTDKVLEEDLRVEFCKSRARAARWEEEVMLLREEMHRVKRFFKHRSDTWRELKKDVDTLIPPENSDSGVREGLKAYASKQARMFSKMEDNCDRLWNALPEWKVRDPWS